jgi:hypothetical protein
MFISAARVAYCKFSGRSITKLGKIIMVNPVIPVIKSLRPGASFGFILIVSGRTPASD